MLHIKHQANTFDLFLGSLLIERFGSAKTAELGLVSYQNLLKGGL